LTAVVAADSPQPDASAHPAAAERALRALMVLAGLVPALVLAWLAIGSWEEQHVRAERSLTRASAVAREHAFRVMRTNDMILGRLADLAGPRSDAELQQNAAALQGALKDLLAGIPELHSLAIFDGQGRPLVTSNAYPLSLAGAGIVAGSDYFTVHHAGDAGLYLSAPLRGVPDAGEARLVASRVRRTADGRFAGIFALALRAAVFDDFYRDLAAAESGSAISLFRGNGLIITRFPLPPTPGMQAPAGGPMMQRVARGDSHGYLSIRSPVDGLQRWIAFDGVGYGLYVSASVSEKAIVAAWAGEVTRLAAILVPAALGLIALGWLALRHIQRERSATRRWREEADRRTAMEQALRHTQRMEALGHLTGGVAHDVNNLLMVVSNNAYLLKRLPPGSDITPQVDAILRAVGTGSRITRQLLAFARRQALRPEVIDLEQMLPMLRDLMRHAVPTSVEVEVAFAPGTPNARADPAELELAVLNLAVNAGDAMPRGGTLTLSVAPSALPESVSISVSDTGIGIPSTLIDRVVEPFFTTKPAGEGTGLGLSQVYGFCQQSGGSLQIRSELGRGTTVEMRLPAASAEVVPPEPGETLPRGGGRLLLVEDNPDVAEATRPLLEAWGYDVLVARDAEAALQRLAAPELQIDVMLSDIVMPGPMDGITLARRVRQQRPEIPIVLVTGYAGHAAKAAADGFPILQKPWMPDALANALAQAVRSHAAPAVRSH
jgi:two-component system, NtrC family, sensor kinase